MLIVRVTREKTNFEIQRNFNAKTALKALFEIRFWSTFFALFRFFLLDVERRRNYSEVTKVA